LKLKKINCHLELPKQKCLVKMRKKTKPKKKKKKKP
jgi:hypothetical protein